MSQFLYFDFGMVLVSFSQERRLSQLAVAAQVDRSTIERELFQPDQNSLFWRMERGEIGPDEVYRAFAELAHGPTQRSGFERAASDIFEPMGKTIELVERLTRAGNRIGILSNTSPLDWRFSLVRFPFLERLFETHVLSYEVGAMKPERTIYDEAVSRIGIQAAEVFFVDDREDNVAGALAAGLDAVQFTSIEALTAALRSRNIPLA